MESEEVLEAKRRKISESGVDARDLQPELTNKLTYYALLKLFAWLSRDDLVSAQRVCHSWRAAAHDQSLWKDIILTLYKDYHYENIKNISTMKAVRNINGDAENSIINLILENVIELKRLNCVFQPAITSLQIQKLLDAYPQIESITLDITSPDIVRSIEKLKTSEHLKEVCFCTSQIYDCKKKERAASKNDCQQCLLQVFEILGDLNSFRALESVDIEQCTNRDVFDNRKCSNAVGNFIWKRSRHLSSLTAQPCTDTVKKINYCVNLKKLSLSIEEKCHVGPKIENMNELEVLEINVREANNYGFASDLRNSLNRNSWEHLKEVSFTVSFPQEVQILKTVIQNAKLLKKLLFYDYREVTGENQIAEIGTLFKLESLNLYGLKTLSEKSLSTISKCNKLKHLSVFACKSVENQCFHVANTIRGMKNLTEFFFDTDYYRLHFSGRASIKRLLSEYPPDA